MVNWHDPVLLLKDYIAFIKLGHTIAGIYIWETVITVGFELDVLQGKRPYRWTIWPYLGTRYTGLLVSVFFFMHIDGENAPCHQMTILDFAFGYVCWSFATLIIVLRVIAIWNRNIIVSLISVGLWFGALTWNIWGLAVLATTYDPFLNTCVGLDTHRDLLNAIGILTVDVILLLAMLIGLLRHPYRTSTGMWKFLYQQCIIWIALAILSEIPPVVFLIVNLSDAWNQMFLLPTVSIMSIGAARMYRSLSDRGSLTEYVSSDLPQFSLKNSIPSAPCMDASTLTTHFASVMQSGGPQMGEVPAFLPADQKHVEFIPGRLNPGFAL